MAEADADDRRPWWGVFASRPRLLGALLLGTTAGLGLAKFVPGLPGVTDGVLGWDVLCAAFMLSVSAAFIDHSPDDIRARAEREDEGRGLILTLVLIAATASIAAIAAELSFAKGEHGWLKIGHIALAFGTVAASWLMMQLVFALHYAHEYYDENPDCGGRDMKGLAFPGGESPDYWDFIHFAVVIGVACATADVEFTSKQLRRIGTVHSLVSFAFNTIIVALTINLLAGLF
ncbi:MAG TPA: DUF1345 domain-containing protein [Phenylobacterium sp.]|uniref:DUF1345 domain-containing protein n=1 Tax=Phenylobacterium sp. TaxID=1871053 RepID=UPI002C222D59|nr:DUF1345 domain-containing protein [Phenylobacterium sp.]HSV03337.1 DUF1345 domain-containing protein [Phenylobacterium sp.]